MEELLLSVVVPVRNAEEYIVSLADAFAWQAADTFEVIFVDDGSTDSTAELLSGIMSVGAFRTLVVRQKNAGVSAARNAGMARASGRYLAFVDADDMISPDYITTLTSYAARGGSLYVFSHSRVVQGNAVYDDLSGSEREMSPDALLDAFLCNPTRFGVYDFLINRAFLGQAKLRFPQGYSYYEDYDFTLRLLNAAKRAWTVDTCVYCYRAAPGSAMSTFSDERIRCLELFDERRSQYLRHRTSFYGCFRKWFVARLLWSVLWQASVAMRTCEVQAFAKRIGMRAQMKRLTDYPDMRVRLSARAYMLFPGLVILLLRARGRGKTLLRRGYGK